MLWFVELRLLLRLLPVVAWTSCGWCLFFYWLPVALASLLQLLVVGWVFGRLLLGSGFLFLFAAFFFRWIAVHGFPAWSRCLAVFCDFLVRCALDLLSLGFRTRHLYYLYAWSRYSWVWVVSSLFIGRPWWVWSRRSSTRFFYASCLVPSFVSPSPPSSVLALWCFCCGRFVSSPCGVGCLDFCAFAFPFCFSLFVWVSLVLLLLRPWLRRCVLSVVGFLGLSLPCGSSVPFWSVARFAASCFAAVLSLAWILSRPSWRGLTALIPCSWLSVRVCGFCFISRTLQSIRLFLLCAFFGAVPAPCVWPRSGAVSVVTRWASVEVLSALRLFVWALWSSELVPVAPRLDCWLDLDSFCWAVWDIVCGGTCSEGHFLPCSYRWVWIRVVSAPFSSVWGLPPSFCLVNRGSVRIFLLKWRLSCRLRCVVLFLPLSLRSLIEVPNFACFLVEYLPIMYLSVRAGCVLLIRVPVFTLVTMSAHVFLPPR